MLVVYLGLCKMVQLSLDHCMKQMFTSIVLWSGSLLVLGEQADQKRGNGMSLSFM